MIKFLFLLTGFRNFKQHIRLAEGAGNLIYTTSIFGLLAIWLLIFYNYKYFNQEYYAF